MGFFYGLLIVFEGLLSLMLITIIFMQKTKGGMGGSAFGGGAGEAIFGSRMGNVLTKATVVLGAIFLFNTILLTILTARQQGGGSVMDSVDVAPPVTAPGGMPGGLAQPDMPPPAGGPIDLPDPTAETIPETPPVTMDAPGPLPADAPVLDAPMVDAPVVDVPITTPVVEEEEPPTATE